MLLYMDGFEHQTFGPRDWVPSSTASITFQPSDRLDYGQCVRINPGGNSLKRTFTPSAKIILGVAVKTLYSALASPYLIMLYGDSGTVAHVQLRRLPNSNALAIYRGTTLIATGPETFTDGWHYVEISATIHDTAGRVIVKVDGATYIDFTGDTKNAGTATMFDTVVFGPGSNNNEAWFDDLYICNDQGTTQNDFLGEVRVHTMTPNGPGTHTGLASSSGANYTAVDELPVNSADYVSGTSGKDTYVISDLPAGVGTIHGVLVAGIARKTDAGYRALKSILRTGGTDYVGSTTVLGTSDTGVSVLHGTNPATSAAWTVPAVNALEIGVEVV